VSNILKLSAQRFKQSSAKSQADSSISELANAFESDRGRVLNSAAVRRLQQKTQVFPLEKNSAVRSRLTHSLEVMQVGRFIAQSICLSPKAKTSSLLEYRRALETTVEMACVLHDVGNPPFGHFGETAISQWFEDNLISNYEAHCDHSLSEQEVTLLQDAMHFEGNAQAIRLVHSLMNLNLTNTLVASVLKYTRCGTESKPSKSDALHYLKKKVGYYFSEKMFVDGIHTQLNIATGHRHPATYIMEAADDISYCMADLEDAVEKGILSVEQLKDALIEEYKNVLEQFSLDSEKSEKASQQQDESSRANANFTEQKYKDVPGNLKMDFICNRAYQAFEEEDIRKESAFFIKFRVEVVHPLVNHATERFLNNLPSVLAGSFNHALLEDNSYAHAISKTLKNVALKHVFCVKEVETIELQGYQIMHGLLNKFSCLLRLNALEFKQVCKQQTSKFPLQTRLIKRIGKKHVATYTQAISNIQEHGIQKQTSLSSEDVSFGVLEYYYRCRLIQDHISGMTDQFALDEYRTLHAL